MLFLAVDDLKPTLGCYGDALAKTPYIDAIAARGIVFENAHGQWPVCGPSRASLKPNCVMATTPAPVSSTRNWGVVASLARF